MVKLTQYSHGAGCGCKLSPKVLADILKTNLTQTVADSKLLVGNDSCDDAAVYQLNESTGIVSTTDFFMPIVDCPFTFGRIAAANALSDVYAMGGSPIMAIAILGWPIKELAASIAQQVLDGGRAACAQANILLAGGHSIDAPEPIFGLAVTGQVDLKYLKKNNTAKAGNVLYLTKPLGVGILSTAQKQKKLDTEHESMAINSMCRLNSVGERVAKLPGVTAMTDVTGFGLAGHLLEVCRGSGLTAHINFSALPLLDHVQRYYEQDCIPGGTQRNFSSVFKYCSDLTAYQQAIVCDPQTSGGLLIAVEPTEALALQDCLEEADCCWQPIGELTSHAPDHPTIYLD